MFPKISVSVVHNFVYLSIEATRIHKKKNERRVITLCLENSFQNKKKIKN